MAEEKPSVKKKEPTPLDIYISYQMGGWDTLESAAVGIWDICTNFDGVVDGIGYAFDNPGETWDQIKKSLSEYWDENWTKGDAASKSRVIGRLVSEVAVSVFVAKGLDKLAKSATAIKSVQKLTTGAAGIAAKITKASSTVLRQRLIAAGVKVPKWPNAAHHIVAGEAKMAAESRKILQKFGIDINDAANGVFLPTVKGVSKSAYHPGLHTNAYYNKVNEALRKATSKADAEFILKDLNQQLLKGSF